MSLPDAIVAGTGSETAPASTADEPAVRAALAAVASAFASLGRVFFCADASFRVLHSSSQLDRLLGPGAALHCEGQPLSGLLGEELFGAAGTLRQLLLAGERREGWRSSLAVSGRRAAARLGDRRPVPGRAGAVCDPRVAYVIVLRPAEEEQAASAPVPSPA